MDPDCYEIKCREYVASPVAKIRELNETEQYKEETIWTKMQLPRWVLGKDDRGFVRGMGGGISKTELIDSTVPREKLRQQVLKTRDVEDRVHTLEVTVETLMAGLSCNPSTSNASAQGMNGGGYQIRSHGVILRNMRKRCVALVHIDRNRPPGNDEFHLVQIDEVFLEYEALCDGDGTFKDVIIGQKILWPLHYVSLISTDGDGF